MAAPLASVDAQSARDLAERIRSGDPAAESWLVSRYRPGLLIMLRRRCPALAEDLCQDTLRVALDGIRQGRLREPGHLASYLWGIAANLARQEWRHERRAARLEEADGIPDPGESPESGLLRAEHATGVRKALSTLAPRDRALLRAVYLEGREKEEVCRALGLTSSQFDVVKWRALRRLGSACAPRT